VQFCFVKATEDLEIDKAGAAVEVVGFVKGIRDRIVILKTEYDVAGPTLSARDTHASSRRRRGVRCSR